MSNGTSSVPPIETWPPPRAASIDPYGLQTGSTGSTAAGLLLTATGGASGPIASALGLGGSTKVLAAGLSLAAFGDASLCAGLVLIGLGIVLNLASLMVRRQLLRDYENEYVAAKDALERKRKAAGGPEAKGAADQPNPPRQ